jgi:hypothetical protein
VPRSVLLGRVVRAGEPLWLQSDTEAVLEYLHDKSLMCSGCGLPREDTMTPDAERLFVSRALRCHACAARDRAARKFSDQKGDTSGLFFTLERAP